MSIQMVQIRRARPKDAAAIYKIAEQNSFRAAKKDKNSTRGFLVSNYTLEDYRKFVNILEHVYVLENRDREIQGFLLVYQEGEINRSLTVYREIDNRSRRPYAIIKQVCVAPEAHRRGYGSVLYRYIMNVLKVDIYLSVVLEPHNEQSLRFHNKLGFTEAFRVRVEDGKMRSVLWRKHK